jgi:glucosamine--fructose-6-phosphate aminotransferase (isomerizing)
MCGIFGTRANPAALAQVVSGLFDLSYRGYDSWGVAFAGKETMAIHKQIGLVPPELDLEMTTIASTRAIGHTRWSTHGEPNETNAHPHQSYDGRFAVVHNGIIENYLLLKKKCGDIQFLSETDTEVIPHLIAKHVGEGASPCDAVRLVAKQLDGRYAFVVLDRQNDSLMAIRRGSPLVVGLDGSVQYIASDALALSRYAKSIAYLDDDQLIYCDENGITLLDLNAGEALPLSFEAFSREITPSSKDGYAHFMRKEIGQQLELLTQPATNALPLEIIGLSFERLRQLKRIIILGCGTSWHAGLVAEYWIERLTGIPVEVEYASEFRYRAAPLSADDCVIAISQSGETADTNAAVELAKEKLASILAICNTDGSTLTRLANATLLTHAGPEIGVASTKAFTTQLCVLYQFTLILAVSRETLSAQEVRDKQQALRQLSKALEASIAIEEDIIRIAKRIYKNQHALFLGRGLHFPIALEAALKLKEVSYIHAEGYPAAEMKHGPIALIDKDMPVFFIATQDDSYQKIRANIAEVKSRGGYVVALANEGDDCLAEQVDDILWLPKVSAELAPIVSVIPFQLLAYHTARLRNCDIDKPRNLAKSVTVE